MVNLIYQLVYFDYLWYRMFIP